jgi:hypothetical protein
MGTGTTITTGGRRVRRMYKTPSTVNNNKKIQAPFGYGRVRSLNQDNSITYELITDNFSTNKIGDALPFHGNNLTSVKESDIVPLVRGPNISVNNAYNQYDKTIYYLDPITIYNDPSDNTSTPTGTNEVVYEGPVEADVYGDLKRVYDQQRGLVGRYAGFENRSLTPTRYIRDEYRPAWQRAFSKTGGVPNNWDGPAFGKGLRLLMEAHAIVEGFYPGAHAYDDKNPGNVGTCTDCTPKTVKKFPTLEEGIRAQYNKVLKGCLNNTSSMYKSNMTLFEYLSLYAPEFIPIQDSSGKITGWKKSNDVTAYTNNIIGYFKKEGSIDIKAEITMKALSEIT